MIHVSPREPVRVGHRSLEVVTRQHPGEGGRSPDVPATCRVSGSGHVERPDLAAVHAGRQCDAFILPPTRRVGNKVGGGYKGGAARTERYRDEPQTGAKRPSSERPGVTLSTEQLEFVLVHLHRVETPKPRFPRLQGPRHSHAMLGHVEEERVEVGVRGAAVPHA